MAGLCQSVEAGGDQAGRKREGTKLVVMERWVQRRIGTGRGRQVGDGEVGYSEGA